MGLSAVTYALAKKYTDETASQFGGLKGAPCKVKSVERSGGITTVTLEWENDEGETRETEFQVLDGAKGDKGDTGAKGDKGDKGDQGDQGIQGEQGIQGIQGAPGPQGAQGIQGVKGDKGDDGYPFLIYASYDDLSEFNEEDFPQKGLMFMINTEVPGEGYPVYRYTADGTDTPYSLVVYLTATGIKGEKGDKGDTGAQGPQGIQGIKGDKGDKGDTGEQGIQGPQGEQGIQGIQGPQGIQGETGPQGVQGEKGDKGDKGDIGADGITVWVAEESYEVNDVVIYDDIIYVCDVANEDETFNEQKWTAITSRAIVGGLSYTATLLANGWNQSTHIQTVTFTNYEEEFNGVIGVPSDATAAQKEVYKSAGIDVVGQSNNEVTLYAKTIPEIDLPVMIYCGAGSELPGDYLTAANPTGTGALSLNRKANTTVGDRSVAIGKDTTATALGSFATGQLTEATNVGASASGTYSKATGYESHAEGYNTLASGSQSHAEGYESKATGGQSHAGGSNSEASGINSFAHGSNLKAAGYCQTVLGCYNEEDLLDKYALIIGNGRSTGPDTATRQNAFAITNEGEVYSDGDMSVPLSKKIKLAKDEWGSDPSISDYTNLLSTSTPYGGTGFDQAQIATMLDSLTGTWSINCPTDWNGCGFIIPNSILSNFRGKTIEFGFSDYTLAAVHNNPYQVEITKTNGDKVYYQSPQFTTGGILIPRQTGYSIQIEVPVECTEIRLWAVEPNFTTTTTAGLLTMANVYAIDINELSNANDFMIVKRLKVGSSEPLVNNSLNFFDNGVIICVDKLGHKVVYGTPVDPADTTNINMWIETE